MISHSLGTPAHVELPQGPVHYRERGSGSPLVFVHGGLANGDLWRNVVPHLADSYRCITPDWPKGSHTVPMKPDADLSAPGMARLVIDFLDALQLNRVTLVANDSGGAISQIVATEYPERVDRLVLTSCDTFRQFPPRYLKPLHLISQIPGAGPRLGLRLAQAWRFKPVYSIFYWSIIKKKIDPAILRSYLDPLADPAIQRDLVKFFTGTGPRHTLKAASKFSIFTRPTLVVWAENDLWFARRNGKKLARLIPHAEFELMPDSRTFIPEDQPEALARTIRKFLERAPESVADSSACAGVARGYGSQSGT